MHPDNLGLGELFGAHHGFKVCTGTRYLGSYIGNDESKGDLFKKQTEKWERNIFAVTKIAGKYPQER